MSLSAQLRAVIKASGLSLYEIAKRAKMPYAMVHRAASGATEPQVKTVTRIAKAVGYAVRLVKE